MSDIPALWVNVGILILTGVMALVAVVQARSALRDAGKAEEARDKAIAAQEASAEALSEANRIAGEARDLLMEQDARATERHHVEWEPFWQEDTGKWLLVNRGVDSALDVRLVIDGSVIGRQPPETEDELPQHSGIPVQFPKQFVGTGQMPTVLWRVEWRSPRGAHHVEEGRYPRVG